MTKAAASKDERGVIERGWARRGIRFAGVDEVGRGCIAGPVYAACVILDFKKLAVLEPKDRDLIRDSKKLSPAQRARVLPLIEAHCLGWALGIAAVPEIERLGIQQATFLAMRRAIADAGRPFDRLLVDGNQEVQGYDGPQRTVVKGDWLCYSIAAASIIAKEARDAFMRAQALLYPDYGFDEHVGYATAEHLDRLARHGVTPLHRRNFEPIRSYVRGEPVLPREKVALLD